MQGDADEDTELYGRVIFSSFNESYRLSSDANLGGKFFLGHIQFHTSKFDFEIFHLQPLLYLRLYRKKLEKSMKYAIYNV